MAEALSWETISASLTSEEINKRKSFLEEHSEYLCTLLNRDENLLHSVLQYLPVREKKMLDRLTTAERAEEVLNILMRNIVLNAYSFLHNAYSKTIGTIGSKSSLKPILEGSTRRRGHVIGTHSGIRRSRRSHRTAGSMRKSSSKYGTIRGCIDPIEFGEEIRKCVDLPKILITNSSIGSKEIREWQEEQQQLTHEHLSFRRCLFKGQAMEILFTEDPLILSRIGILQLNWCSLTDVDIENISHFLRGPNNIHDLELEGNHITDEGAISLSDALRNGHRLGDISLDVSSNQIGMKGAKHLIDTWKDCRPDAKLLLNNNQVLRVPNGNPNNVYILDNTIGTHRLLRICERHVKESFQVINLSNVGLTDQHLRIFCMNFGEDSSLKELIILENRLTKFCLPHLMQLMLLAGNLRHIFHDLDWRTHVEKTNNILRFIDVQSNIILQLGLFKNGLIERLEDFENREQLGMITEYELHLSLICFHIYGSASKPLDFTDCPIGDARIKMVNDCLTKSKKVTRLSVANTGITSKGIERLCDISAKQRKPRPMYVAIQHLNLRNNDLGTEGAKILCNSFQLRWTLWFLDLSNTNLGVKGIVKIAQTLKDDKTMKDLNLSKNKISDRGVESIRSLLQGNTVLIKLDISHNDIHGKGYKYIGQALEKNRSLETLYMHSNELKIDNPKIQKWFDILYSGVSSAGQLCVLGLDDCGFSPEQQRRVNMVISARVSTYAHSTKAKHTKSKKRSTGIFKRFFRK